MVHTQVRTGARYLGHVPYCLKFCMAMCRCPCLRLERSADQWPLLTLGLAPRRASLFIPEQAISVKNSAVCVMPLEIGSEMLSQYTGSVIPCTHSLVR